MKNDFEFEIYLEPLLEDDTEIELFVAGRWSGKYIAATQLDPEEFPEVEWHLMDNEGNELEYSDLSNAYPNYIIPTFENIEERCYEGAEFIDDEDEPEMDLDQDATW